MTCHQPYYPMNPHPGISLASRTVPDYCYASPNGGNNDGSRPTANYSLLTANWTFTFSIRLTMMDAYSMYSHFMYFCRLILK